MTTYARDLWGRAKDAHRAARHVLDVSPDAAASRAYYAAFYAASAALAQMGKTFSKHSAVEVAVHRDLVHQGTWPTDVGADYAALVRLRKTGDYGGSQHVSHEAAEEAVEMAARILSVVQQAHADLFSQLEEPD